MVQFAELEQRIHLCHLIG